MDSFKTRYINRCAELGIQPSHTVLEKVRPRGANDEEYVRTGKEYPERLDLSGSNLTFKGSDALSSALSEDVVFTRVSLADAFLGDEGCGLISSVLKTNSTIEHLDLRGNNIRAEGAIAIAQALKVNATLKTLQLEWNCVGIWEQGIRVLADALGVNQGLQELDLRNNKIGPQAAAALAGGLKRNGTLKRLDLRWNNAGFIGGRAFADALRTNTTLIQLDLTGNEVPDDVISSIAVALERNKDRHAHVLHTRAHTEHLTSTLQQLTLQHDDTIRSLATKLANTDEHASSLSQRLGNAAGEIERSRALERALEARLEEVRRQKTETEDILVRERGESSVKINNLLKDLNAEREFRVKADETHRVKLSEATQRTLACEAQLRDVEMKMEIFRRDKAILIEELEQVRNREKIAFKNGEEKLQALENTITRRMQALLQAKDDEHGEHQRKLEERLRVQELARERAEQELEAHRTRWLQQKLHLEEQTIELESKWRRDEEKRRADLETRLSQAVTTRDTIQRTFDEAQRSYIHSLSERDLAVAKFREQVDQHREEVAMVKSDLVAATREATELRKRLEGLTKGEESQRDKLRKAEAEAEHERSKRKEEKAEREKEFIRMKERIRSLEDEGNRRREEERERRKHLERAVLDYTRGDVAKSSICSDLA